MQTNTKFYSIWADANAVGGFLEAPMRNIIPTVAPVSLPAVGGLTSARSEAFTFERIVSVSSAYTRVSGQENADGTVSILATAVVEGLNILEVIEADRIVAQVSITVSSVKAPILVSKAGTQFDGLKVGGVPYYPKWNEKLHHLASDELGRAQGFTVKDVAEQGQKQAGAILEGFRGSHDYPWAERRFKWMTAEQPRSRYLCSLIDGFDGAGRESVGHCVVVPGFGRFFFGEVLSSQDTVQVVSIRAELGCPVQGKITVNTGGGGGVGHDP
jgi:hypothetical protein